MSEQDELRREYERLVDVALKSPMESGAWQRAQAALERWEANHDSAPR